PRPLLARADAAISRLFGPDHMERAQIAANLGDLEQGEHHWDAALAAFRGALAILDRIEGPQSYDAGSAHGEIATVLSLAGRHAEAAAEAEREVAIFEALGPDGEPRMVRALYDLGAEQLDLGKPKLAVASAERAVALGMRQT